MPTEDSAFVPRSKATGARRIWLAFVNSIAGLRAAWQGEAAFRQESILACLLIPLSFVVGREPVEYILMVGSVVLVLIVELLNSAIEETVDRIGLDDHPMSKRAKDIASAAVFISMLLVPFVWITIILDRVT